LLHNGMVTVDGEKCPSLWATSLPSGVARSATDPMAVRLFVLQAPQAD